MSALSRGQGLQEGRSIYKMAENKKDRRCRQLPMNHLQNLIYFAIPSLQSDKSLNSSKHKAMTRIGGKGSAN